MSLPPTFSTAAEYFEECLWFLERYRDLYWRSNTDVLTDDLNFRVALTDEDSLASLNRYSNAFFEDITRLTPRYDGAGPDDSCPTVQSPMSQKKAHEVVHLTEAIKDMCREVDCQTVVDLGAGMGYIDLQIFVSTGYNVLGLEGQESLYVNAKEHQRKYHSDSLAKVKYIRHVISESSDTNIGAYLKDKFPNDKKGFCFMGLHACGDLTVSAINLFLKMTDSRALVVTPCCYHKMVLEADDLSRFKNFPLSETFKKLCEEFDAHTHFSIPFMRMAAQPAHMKDADINDRVFALLARALLRVYARRHNCTVLRLKRKAVHFPSIKNDFAKYVEHATTKGYKLSNTNPEYGEEIIDMNPKELLAMWEKMPTATFTNAALYISYQNHLPPIFENLILYDRLVYLKEHGIESCYFKKVVNEKVSPKCLSLFASKADCHK